MNNWLEGPKLHIVQEVSPHRYFKAYEQTSGYEIWEVHILYPKVCIQMYLKCYDASNIPANA